MIQYDSDKPTLLERRLEDVLNDDVQSARFGCKLKDLHVRIGSKIHVRTFFEAELLFHNNYYTSRFAYWLYNELRSSEELDLQHPFVLVGCENYSEMLLNELCNMFDKSGIAAEYLIYEERIAGKFRGKRSLDMYQIPMVETNKESIVPMHAVGIRRKNKINGIKLKDEDEKIQDLSRFLIYKHIERNGNHFNYYFATERLWSSSDIRNKVREWLEDKEGELFRNDSRKVYDIIVAPLHYSNTVFVEEVNRMSKSSISDYIEDQNYFLAYFNLRISSMRVNSDACVLCKK